MFHKQSLKSSKFIILCLSKPVQSIPFLMKLLSFQIFECSIMTRAQYSDRLGFFCLFSLVISFRRVVASLWGGLSVCPVHTSVRSCVHWSSPLWVESLGIWHVLLIDQSLSHKFGSERASEWASEWAPRSASNAVWSKRVSEQCEQTSKQMSEWPST